MQSVVRLSNWTGLSARWSIPERYCQEDYFGIFDFLDLLLSCIFFFFASAVIHEYSEGIANGSWRLSILLLDPPAEELGRWYGDFIHWNQDELEDCAIGLSLPTPVGLEGGVENSSSGCNSSNFVNVTMTLTVGTTGIATWK